MEDKKQFRINRKKEVVTDVFENGELVAQKTVTTSWFKKQKGGVKVSIKKTNPGQTDDRR